MIKILIIFKREVDLKNFLLISVLLCFYILVSISELLGISLILPIIMNLLGDKSEYTPSIIIKISELVGVNFKDNSELIIFALSLFTLKAIIQSAAIYFQTKFAFLMRSKLSERMLGFYLDDFKKWILKNNAYLEKARNITLRVDELVHGSLVPILMIFSDIIMTIFLLATLLLMIPAKILLLVILFLGFIILFKIGISNILRKVGEKRNNFELQRLSYSNACLKSAVEINTCAVNQAYINDFSLINYKSRIFGILENFLQNMPRVWLELFFVILILIISYNLRDGNAVSTVIMMSLILIRLMTPVNRLVHSFAIIGSTSSAVDEFFQLGFVKKKTNQQPSSHVTKITVQHKNKKLNFEIGKINIIKGSSGSGKSTILNKIIGMIDDDTVIFYNNDLIINSDSIPITYVRQTSNFIQDSVIENIKFKRNLNIDDVENITKNIGLNIDLSKNLGPDGLGLSGGQLQRVALSRALIKFNPVILLDESTSGLDAVSEKMVFDYLESICKKSLVIVVTHGSAYKNLNDIYINEL